MAKQTNRHSEVRTARSRSMGLTHCVLPGDDLQLLTGGLPCWLPSDDTVYREGHTRRRRMDARMKLEIRSGNE